MFSRNSMVSWRQIPRWPVTVPRQGLGSGTTYVYRQESYWDKSLKQPRNKQVCIGKLDESGEVVYNKRFREPEAREALEQGAAVAESVLIGQRCLNTSYPCQKTSLRPSTA